LEYKGELSVNTFPDLVVKKALILDTKTIERITDHERRQILNYLRISGLQVGVILNFKHARLEWERMVLTKQPRMNANEREFEGPPDLQPAARDDERSFFLFPFAFIRVHSR